MQAPVPMIMFRTGKFRHRGAWIGAMIALQTLVLGAGGYALLQATKSGLESGVSDGLAAENARLAENFLQLVKRHASEPFQYGSIAWAAVQQEAERFALPAGCQLMVLDDSNRVLCHSALEQTPALRRLDLTWQQVRAGDDASIRTIAEFHPTGRPATLRDAMSEQATMALVADDRARVKVLVHRDASGAQLANSRVTGDALVWAAGCGVVLVGLTLLGSIALVRRYDSAVERLNAQLEHEVDRRTRQGLAIRNGLVFGLAKLAEERDNDTGRHLERICQYSVLVAEELRARGEFGEITPAWIERLRLAASMHDIGKVGIPDSILHKPGPLTTTERAIMQEHARIGAETIAAIRQRVGDDELLNMGIQVAMSHHERFDGAGYPHRLTGEQIPLAARVVAIADVYDALTTRRAYKQAMTHTQAREAIREQRGTQFDPRIADAFEHIHREIDAVRHQLAQEDAIAPPHNQHRLQLVAARVAA
jgi:HD-GYP domain-containing protein (c-di-GMP phosphodiesterase class II)